MKKVDVSTRVETDGELRIRSPELKAGQRVDATLVIADADDSAQSIMELRGIFRGAWASAEAVDRYLEDERDARRR